MTKAKFEVAACVASKIVVWVGSEKHAHRSAKAASDRYMRAQSQGIPCAIYVDGECAASANGEGSRVNQVARDAIFG